MIAPKVRAAVLFRDGCACVRCGRSVFGISYSLQHRRARGMGGSRLADTNQPQNLATVCGHATSPEGCHHWIESHPTDAIRLGYRIPQGHEPLLVPLQVKGRGWVLLNADATYEQLDNDESLLLAELAGEA